MPISGAGWPWFCALCRREENNNNNQSVYTLSTPGIIFVHCQFNSKHFWAAELKRTFESLCPLQNTWPDQIKGICLSSCCGLVQTRWTQTTPGRNHHHSVSHEIDWVVIRLVIVIQFIYIVIHIILNYIWYIMQLIYLTQKYLLTQNMHTEVAHINTNVRSFILGSTQESESAKHYKCKKSKAFLL